MGSSGFCENRDRCSMMWSVDVQGSKSESGWGSKCESGWGSKYESGWENKYESGLESNYESGWGNSCVNDTDCTSENTDAHHPQLGSGLWGFSQDQRGRTRENVADSGHHVTSLCNHR